MSSYHGKDCDVCLYKDNPILIVGSRRFSSEILANYICTNTPAKWQIIEKLGEIPVNKSETGSDWRLIFIDCLGFTTSDIVLLLNKKVAHYLPGDIIALFNLQIDKTDLPQLIDSGVRGFFYQSDPSDFILKGICALKKGEYWIPRSTLIEYLSKRPQKIAPEKHMVSALTPREREVLVLLTSGLSNDKIASKLFISKHTVKTHIYKILKKIKVKNRLQAALWAARHLQ